MLARHEVLEKAVVVAELLADRPGAGLTNKGIGEELRHKIAGGRLATGELQVPPGAGKLRRGV